MPRGYKPTPGHRNYKNYTEATLEEVLRAIRTKELPVRAAAQRQLLRPKIYDITQFGCMMQATTTIENSINSLFEKLFVKETENNLLQTENEKLKCGINNKLGKITLLEREVDILKEKYEKDASKLTLLSSQNEDLIQSKSEDICRIKGLEEIVNQLNNSIKAQERNIQTMTQKENLTNNCIKIISEKQKDVAKLSLLVQKKYIFIENEQICIENSLKQVENIIDGINNKLNSFVKIYSTLKLKMENIHTNLQDNSCFIVSKCKDFQENVKQHIVDIPMHKLSQSQSSPNFHVKGNPVEDLTKQIEENNEKIKVLQNENIKLQKIIMRFNRIRD